MGREQTWVTTWHTERGNTICQQFLIFAKPTTARVWKSKSGQVHPVSWYLCYLREVWKQHNQTALQILQVVHR
jgi:hypothetical protein